MFAHTAQTDLVGKRYEWPVHASVFRVAVPRRSRLLVSSRPVREVKAFRSPTVLPRRRGRHTWVMTCSESQRVIDRPGLTEQARKSLPSSVLNEA
jgi:hypothetical protein